MDYVRWRLAPLDRRVVTDMSELHTTSFWVNRVPKAVYSTDPDVSLRSEFEVIFSEYDKNVQFTYLKSFNRVRVTYPTVESAELARANLNNCEFQGTNLKVRPVVPIKIGSDTLNIPKKTKQFLISPPASPPVGWEPVEESNPSVDFSLVTALASLRLPGDSHELHEGTQTTPSIFVNSPDDSSESELIPSVLRENQEQNRPIRMSCLPRTVVQTSRPPLK